MVIGEWVDRQFKFLKEGDVFQLYEGTGEPVVGIGGATEFTCCGDAYLNEDGIWTVDILAPDEETEE